MFSYYGIAGGYSIWEELCPHHTRNYECSKNNNIIAVDGHYLGGVCDHITLQRITSVRM